MCASLKPVASDLGSAAAERNAKIVDFGENTFRCNQARLLDLAIAFEQRFQDQALGEWLPWLGLTRNSDVVQAG
jgi:hypothetical protein